MGGTPLLTPASIADLLARHGLKSSRALGQHFLADPNTARRIVRLARIQPGDPVLEIGPGIGSLTLALLDAGANVTALELDHHVLPALAEVVSGDPAVRIVEGDALTIDLAALLDADDSRADESGDESVEEAVGEAVGWKAVSNLPYNVATPIVVRILETVPAVQTLLVMVQREVGERLVANPGGREYGAVTVKIAYYGAASVVGSVPPAVFYPPPKVDSALVRIDRHATPPINVPSVDALFVLVRAGFAQRRKMLRGALRPVLGDRAVSVLTAAGVDPTARAETLDLDAWAAVARAAA